jgi:large subunit ribosomal protein L21
MYAVIETGGKQYKVSPGEILRVEKLQGNVGSPVELAPVLMIGNGEEVKLGQPEIAGAMVTGEIVAQGRERKIIIFKHKRRKGYRKMQGHRQYFTALRIKEIRES